MVQKVGGDAGRHKKMFYSLAEMYLMFFLISGVGHLGLVTLSRTVSSGKLLMPFCRFEKWDLENEPLVL